MKKLSIFLTAMLLFACTKADTPKSDINEEDLTPKATTVWHGSDKLGDIITINATEVVFRTKTMYKTRINRVTNTYEYVFLDTGYYNGSASNSPTIAFILDKPLSENTAFYFATQISITPRWGFFCLNKGVLNDIDTSSWNVPNNTKWILTGSIYDQKLWGGSLPQKITGLDESCNSNPQGSIGVPPTLSLPITFQDADGNPIEA